MNYYFESFGKKIHLHLYKESSEMLKFWLKRFCPNIKILDSSDDNDLRINFIESINYDYFISENLIEIYGIISENESYIAKFITQCFQKLLIEDEILIIPSACVNKDDSGLLIIGDFWQGKTSVAMNIAKKYDLNLLSDNYVAIKDKHIIGATNYISVRKEDIDDNKNLILDINDRYFYENDCNKMFDLKIVDFLLPYINSGDNNYHIVSKEESIWYLYQKFTRLLCGETILFDGKLPSPNFLTKEISKKILKIVGELLKGNNINYISADMIKIIETANKLFDKGDANNE